MKKILVILISACCFLSCVDLEQYPMSTLTPEGVEYDKANIESFANGLYRELWGSNYSFNCRPQILGLGADDIVSGTYTKRGTFIDELNASTNLHDTDAETHWLNMYKLIRQANTMIDIIPGTNIEPDEVKNPYIGEAYFMRAFAYFSLVRFFGAVPLITDPKCTKDIYGNNIDDAVRANVEEVYFKMIIPDLQKAESLLNNRSRTGDNSAVNKMAARACLMDVYLNVAGWPLKKTEYYEEAKKIGYTFITENVNNYTLVPHYADLWKEATKSSDEEHIFALNHSNVMYSNYGRSYYAIEEGVTAWSDYLADSCFFENHPADERKAFNFVEKFTIPGSPRKIDFRVTSMRSPAIAKYRDYGTIASAQSTGITPIYRYADVLLMYAEAQNMADGAPNDLAYDCLNRIRERAMGGGAYTRAENMDQATFAKAVSDERGWEFFAEFKRWHELVRTEKVYEANLGNWRVLMAIIKAGITPDNRDIYLMPLPLQDIELLKLDQNKR